ncbi:MAG: LptE family protein [Syntrophales bacterium]|nr:LptE family protein [Syntrophales bacterium]
MICIKISRFLGLTASAAFILLISGCGYSFTPTGEHIATRIKTVFVDNFSNRSSEAYVENYLRKAFIDEFIKGRRFKIVGKPEMADAVLKGSIKNLTTSHLSYDINNIAVEERVTMTMDITFEEQSTHEIIWSGKNILGIEDYKVADQLTTESSRQDALIKLANDTAEKVYRLMMSDF